MADLGGGGDSFLFFLNGLLLKGDIYQILFSFNLTQFTFDFKTSVSTAISLWECAELEFNICAPLHFFGDKFADFTILKKIIKVIVGYVN